MTGPRDPAAAGGGWLRAGHADREQVIEALKDAFVDGRLTSGELDTRVGLAMSARTYADLGALTTDLPPAAAPAASDLAAAASPVPASSPASALAASAPDAAAAAVPASPPASAPAAAGLAVPVRRRPLVRAAAGSGAGLGIAAFGLWAHHVVDAGNIPTPYDAWATPLFLMAMFAVLMAVGFVAYGVIASAEQRHARRQLPPPPPRSPGPDGRATRASDRRRGTGADPASPDRRPDQGRVDLRARKSWRHPQIPARAWLPRAARPTSGAA